MEMVSTIGLPCADRTTAWNHLYSTHMSRVEFVPADRNTFGAELRIGRLGPVKLAWLSVDRCSIERSQVHLAHSPRLYSFLLQARGSSLFQHYGHEVRLSEGDFVLCDTGVPHHFETGDPSVTIMVRVAPEILEEFLPGAEQYCGLLLGHAVGATHTAAAMARSLSERVGIGGLRNHAPRIARHLLEMISISYAIAFDGLPATTAASRRRRSDVIRYIEGHLHDPSMTVESVADSMQVSPRYLRALFAPTGEKVSSYMLRRRLEECARRMRDPAWSGTTLMQIALSRGFSSAAHFTRSFHKHFGMSPRQYRRAALPPGTDGH